MREIAIGIDIGGTNTQFGLVTRDGQCLAEGHIPTQSTQNIDAYLFELYQAIQQLLKKTDADFRIAGVGIGAPNGNFFKGTIEFAPNLKWKGVVFLKQMFEEYIRPVYLTNDANAAAMGEMIYGAAKGMKDFIVITLGTGLGSGIVCNGQVLYGHDGFAGELGHTIVVPDGRQCGCGRKGCLETYASASGIKRTVVEMLENTNTDSELRDFSFNDLSAKKIEEAANRNDPIALEAFEFTGKMLGMSLANAVAFSSPEAIFLFGGLANAGSLIFKPTLFHMEKNMLEIFKNKVKLLPSGLKGAQAAILGASALVWSETK